MVDYPNRSDLRNPAKKVARQAAKGQTYGEATKQMESQKAVPMASAPTDATPAPPRPTVTPGSLGRLDRETERPMDSLVGGTPAPTNQTLLPMRDPVVEELEVLYRMYPNDDLADLISALKYGGQ